MAVDDLQTQLARFHADCDERLARLRPTDTLKGLYVRRYFALFEELGGPPLRERAEEAFGERRVFDFLNYPYAALVRTAVIVTDVLAPTFGGVDPFLFEVGRLATTSYLQSPLGRAFLAGFQPSPRTMLVGMPWAIRTTFSFGQRSAQFPEEQRCRFLCRREFSPAPANAGAVHAAVVAVGAKDVSVDIELHDLFNYDLLLRWS